MHFMYTWAIPFFDMIKLVKKKPMESSGGFWESTRNGFQNHSFQQNENFGGNYGYNNG